MQTVSHDEQQHRLDLIWHSLGTLNLAPDANDRDIAINNIQRFFGINRDTAEDALESGPLIELE